MGHNEDYRIAWLLPTMGRGGISWQHILCEFTQYFPQTTVFTGEWAGFVPGFEDTFHVQLVGQTKFVQTSQSATSYGSGFSYASPAIARYLLQFKPQVIFANAFSIWTAIALLLKLVVRWQVIITYEGSSPGVDYQDSIVRLLSRKLMARLADAFIVNSVGGKDYVINSLGAKPERVFAKPFLVPSLQALLTQPNHASTTIQAPLTHPIFLYVGQIIPRKGVKPLLEACTLLKSQNYQNYTVLIIGDGAQRQELEAFTQAEGLTEQVVWLGKVEYGALGSYFQMTDVFIFPTNEDIWGMVLPEAMAFGKPVICSRGAGAVELMAEGENGFVFSPQQSSELADQMKRFIDTPTLVDEMGKKSSQIMTQHTPKAATSTFIQAVELVR